MQSYGNNTVGPKLAWRVKEFCDAAGICRATFYVLLKRGEISTVLLGKRRLIPDSEARRLLAGDQR